jgi:NAD(P)H-dependent FMN reductase
MQEGMIPVKVNEAILLICGSRKPAPGSIAKKSAARELLKMLFKCIKDYGATSEIVDLREVNIPLFDGRDTEEYDSYDLTRFKEKVKSSKYIIISAPAYWGGVSGVVKNMLDLLGGVAYDKNNKNTPFTEKVVGLLVVGADNNSAFNASSQLRTILSSMGAVVLNQQVIIGDPRKISDASELLQQIDELAQIVTTSTSWQ